MPENPSRWGADARHLEQLKTVPTEKKMADKNQTVKETGERVFFPMDLSFARKGIGQAAPGTAKVEFLDEPKSIRVRITLGNGQAKTVTLSGEDIVKDALPDIRSRVNWEKVKKAMPGNFTDYSGKGTKSDDGEDW